MHGVTSWIFLRKRLIHFHYIESENSKDIVWMWNFQRNILWTTWHLLLTIWFHYLFYGLFKDPISLRDKRINVKSNINCFYISLSLWLSWVDRIYISFYIPLSSWLTLWLLWVDRIYILYLYSIVLMTDLMTFMSWSYLLLCPYDIF